MRWDAACCLATSAEVGGLGPAEAQRLEVCVIGVGDRRGPPKVGLGEGALIQKCDVGLPTAALFDDALGVGAEYVAPVCGAADAKGLAPELRRVESERCGEAASEDAGVLGVPRPSVTSDEEGAGGE